MNPLLEQFLSEARELLQGIGEKLMQLEDAPSDMGLMNELFRLVHTLKGNSGLFDLPAMTRVLHAGEDLMDEIRNGRVAFTRELADTLLDAMDFVGAQCDEVDRAGAVVPGPSGPATALADQLRGLLPAKETAPQEAAAASAPSAEGTLAGTGLEELVGGIPEAERLALFREPAGPGLFLVTYRPEPECFFRGEDPFHQARLTPGLRWGRMQASEPWPALGELDAYRCALEFRMLATASLDALEAHFRYVPDQVAFTAVAPRRLALPQGDPNGGPVYEDFVQEAMGLLEAGRLGDLERAARALLELSNPDLWLSSALRWLLAFLETDPDPRALGALILALQTLRGPDWEALAPLEPATSAAPAAVALPALVQEVLDVQREILEASREDPWVPGKARAVAATLAACLKSCGHGAAAEGLDEALEAALEDRSGAPLLAWLSALEGVAAEPMAPEAVTAAPGPVAGAAPRPAAAEAPEAPAPAPAPKAGAAPEAPAAEAAGDVKFGRRAEDSGSGSRSLKVDQAKVDRLMNLIGEMVVSKNALPYLAARAEGVYGVRDLAREIKSQYAVINRIAEEMQDAIMQVRMMPVSFVFQRFPRLVRDTSRKLGKEVTLSVLGEETQADKNIIEALGDPLVHLVRNSLDHGLEGPEQRLAAGKAAAGTLTLRAAQESDRVVIEIEDDGKGIDPEVLKRKAYERGLLDEEALARLSDAEALNLVFAPGLSTAAVVSDLSGRGVGMDVVRTAVEKVNGTIQLESALGRGTRIRLSLPLTMAVTHVMLVEADGQTFGLPMDRVIETVRLPRSRVMAIKHSQAALLRGRIVALKGLNALLGLAAEPLLNEDDELAVLVVRVGSEPVGLIVDGFREVVDVILKPMEGLLGNLGAFAGSALMGDGSVLMVLNVQELF